MDAVHETTEAQQCPPTAAKAGDDFNTDDILAQIIEPEGAQQPNIRPPTPHLSEEDRDIALATKASEEEASRVERERKELASALTDSLSLERLQPNNCHLCCTPTPPATNQEKAWASDRAADLLAETRAKNLRDADSMRNRVTNYTAPPAPPTRYTAPTRREEPNMTNSRTDHNDPPAPNSVRTAQSEGGTQHEVDSVAAIYAVALHNHRITSIADPKFFHQKAIWTTLRVQHPITEDEARRYIAKAFAGHAEQVLAHTRMAHPLSTTEDWWNILGHTIASGKHMSFIRETYVHLQILPGETPGRMIQRAAALRATLPEPIQDRCHRARLITALPYHMQSNAAAAGPTEEDILRACLPETEEPSYSPRDTVYSHDPSSRRRALPEQVFETHPITGVLTQTPTVQGTGIHGSPIGPNLIILSSTWSQHKKCFRCGLVGHIKGQGCDHPVSTSNQDFLLVPSRPRTR